MTPPLPPWRVDIRGWARIRSAVGLVERRSFWLPAQVWGQNFLRVATCTGEWISTPLRDDRILTQPRSDTHQLLFVALMGFAKGSTHPTPFNPRTAAGRLI